MRIIVAAFLLQIMSGCSRDQTVYEVDGCKGRPILIVRIDSSEARIMAPGVLGVVILDSLIKQMDSIDVSNGQSGIIGARKVWLSNEQRAFAKNVVPKLKIGKYERASCISH